jgi:hypothetical protein
MWRRMKFRSLLLSSICVGPMEGHRPATSSRTYLSHGDFREHDRTRTVGRATAADADLLYVRSEFLKITLMLTPNNFPDTMLGASEGAHFWLTLVARGLESESRPLRLTIDWDGRWEDGDAEMRQHLTITRG